MQVRLLFIAAMAGVVFLETPFCSAESPAQMPIPVNEAEAILDPFWSTEISTLPQWAVAPGEGHGLRIKQNWSAVDFEWSRQPVQGPALSLTRRYGIDSARYDKLMARAAVPEGATFRMSATTDKGHLVFQSEPSNGRETEYYMPLDGAARLEILTLEIEAAGAGEAVGWLRWVGLQNSAALELYHARWDFSAMRWDAYLQPPEFRPEFKPRYGIFMTPAELERLRQDHARQVQADGRSGYTDLAEQARTMAFEKGIHEFANSGGSAHMHGRNRDIDAASLPGSDRLAEAALVLQDSDTLRAAARYALSLAASGHWEYGFMSSMPACPWEDRAFRRSYICSDIARVLDLSGEIFTETGRLFLMRRLAEEGIGPINYVTWRHEYIFHCNQLAYFNKGRTYACLVLEREWPRVVPYTDLAYKDTLDNLATVIEPDGGYLEGPSYLSPVVRENYHVIKHYARARGIDLASITPDILRKTSDFAAVVASTTDQDVIPICDAGPEFKEETLSILAELAPESYWVTMLNKVRRRSGKEPLATPGPSLPAFVSLPNTGHLASVRSLDDHLLKIMVPGHKAGATHTHEDKGSFVIEFAGDSFALDPGIVDYDAPIHLQYKHCQRHNMLVPVGTPDRAQPDMSPEVDVKPTGSGDAQTFRAEMDVAPTWRGLFRKHIRTWNAPSPSLLIIEDDYELNQGTGVEFYWQTLLPCRVEGQSVTITGRKGRLVIDVPTDCVVRLDNLLTHEGGQQTRIALCKSGAVGNFTVQVRFNVLGL